MVILTLKIHMNNFEKSKWNFETLLTIRNGVLFPVKSWFSLLHLFSGDRIFPPQTGLTYSTWVCVEKYSDPRTDPHCVRVLTLARHVPGRDHHLVCLSIVISARDKALIVSTHETNLPQPGQGEFLSSFAMVSGFTYSFYILLLYYFYWKEKSKQRK